jgi:predicted histone-like DNA-binding protein
MPTINLISKKQKTGFDKQPAYVTRAQRYNTISTDELVDHAAEDSNVPKAQLRASAEALMLQAKELMLNGHTIEFKPLGFLRFSISCKAVKNKENVSANLVRTRRVIFRPSTRLKAEMRRVNFTTTIVDDSPEP